MQRRSQHERGLTLGELARRHDCELRGQSGARVWRVSTLARADDGSVAFFLNHAYLNDLRSTRAGAVILSEPHAPECPVAALVTPNPYRVLRAWPMNCTSCCRPRRESMPTPRFRPRPWTHLRSRGRGPCGGRGQAGPWRLRGSQRNRRPGASIGEDSRLLANSTVCEGVTMGSRCLVHPGAVLGSDGFGNAPDAGGRWRDSAAGFRAHRRRRGDRRQHHDRPRRAGGHGNRGRLRRSGHMIQRLDQNVPVGRAPRHGCGLRDCRSVRIGRRCRLAGNVGVAGHLEICDDVVLLARTVVTRGIGKPGAYAGSMTPMEEVASWRRNAARFRHLDALHKRVRRLERSG